jgi:acyl carrier protein
MADIAAKVKEIIVNKLGVEESQVTPEASFQNDLGADSLDTVELIMDFERAFDISVSDSDAEKLQTVGAVIEYLEANVKS